MLQRHFIRRALYNYAKLVMILHVFISLVQLDYL